MTIQEQIDELKAELNAALDADERRQIELELETALTQRDSIIAEQNGRIRDEPPL